MRWLRRLFRRPAVIFVPDRLGDSSVDTLFAEDISPMVATFRNAQEREMEGDGIQVRVCAGKIYIRASSGIWSVVMEVTPEHATEIGEMLLEVAKDCLGRSADPDVIQ